MFRRRRSSQPAAPVNVNANAIPSFHVLCYGGQTYHLVSHLADTIFQSRFSATYSHVREFSLLGNKKARMVFQEFNLPDTDASFSIPDPKQNIISVMICVDIKEANFLETIKKACESFSKYKMNIYLVSEPIDPRFTSQINQCKQLAEELHFTFMLMKDAEDHLFENLCQLANKVDSYKGFFDWEYKSVEAINAACKEGAKTSQPKPSSTKSIGRKMRSRSSSQNTSVALVRSKNNATVYLSDANFNVDSFFFTILDLLQEKNNPSRDAYLVLAVLFNLQAKNPEEEKDLLNTFRVILEHSQFGEWKKVKNLFLIEEFPKDISFFIAVKHHEIAAPLDLEQLRIQDKINNRRFSSEL